MQFLQILQEVIGYKYWAQQSIQLWYLSHFIADKSCQLYKLIEFNSFVRIKKWFR